MEIVVVFHAYKLEYMYFAPGGGVHPVGPLPCAVCVVSV